MKYTRTSVVENQNGDVGPSTTTSARQTACSVNATIIAISRPMRSDAQPQKTRLAPLASGLSVVAHVSARVERPHVWAIGPAFAVTSKPPVAISTNITYIM